MSPPTMEPIDTLERLADLCIEAKEVLQEASTTGLEAIDQLLELLLFEIAIKLTRVDSRGNPNGGGGS